MVIGNGLIANAFFEKFSTSSQFLIFASGVSRSKSVNPADFEREQKLVMQYINQYPDKVFVYFSTCSIYDPTEENSPYVLHKLAMENAVCSHMSNFVIFRVSNVVGRTQNDSTIFNFLVRHIKNEIPFTVWRNAFRNIIDVDDVSTVAHHFLVHAGARNEIVNIANPSSYTVENLVREIEGYLGKKGHYTESEKGDFFEIDTGRMRKVCAEIGIGFPDNYVEKLLHKYFDYCAEKESVLVKRSAQS